MKKEETSEQRAARLAGLKRWRDANPDYKKKWRAAHPGKDAGYSKKSHAKHRTKRNAASKQWRPVLAASAGMTEPEDLLAAIDRAVPGLAAAISAALADLNA